MEQAVHSPGMDPLDPDGIPLDGLSCAVCEESVPAASVQLLARREGLTFVQLQCPECSCTSLAFLVAPSPGDPERRGDHPPVTTAAPLSGDDVLDMHGFLEGWQGGLRELLGGDPLTGRRP